MSKVSILEPLKKRKRNTAWQDEMLESDVVTLREARDTINDLLSINDTIDERLAFADYICDYWASCKSLREIINKVGSRAFYYKRLIKVRKYDPIPCSIETFEEFQESGCWCGRNCMD